MEVNQDSFLQQIRSDLLANMKEHTWFLIREGQLLYKNRFVIPRKSFFIPIILQMYHDSPVVGHWADVKTYLRITAV